MYALAVFQLKQNAGISPWGSPCFALMNVQLQIGIEELDHQLFLRASSVYLGKDSAREGALKLRSWLDSTLHKNLLPPLSPDLYILPFDTITGVPVLGVDQPLFF